MGFLILFYKLYFQKVNTCTLSFGKGYHNIPDDDVLLMLVDDNVVTPF